MKCVVIALIFTGLLVAACDDNGGSDEDSAAEFQVLYFVRTGADDDDPNEPEFELRAANRTDSDSRLVASLPAIRDEFDVSREGDVAVLPTDYTDHPELLRVDLKSGDVATLTDSTGGNRAAELGPRGAIALCNEQGDFLAGNIDAIDSLTELLPGAGPAAGCPSAVWNADGGLVFKAPTPLAAPEFGDDYAFYILDASLETTKVIPIPELHQPRSRQTGPVSITLSADGARLAYIAGPFGGQAIHILDIVSGAISDTGRPGYEIRFSPTDADLIAVRDLDDDSLVVWKGDEELARLSRVDDFAFSWCPESSTIALASVASVSLWNWRSGEVTPLAHTDLPNGRFIGDDVACVRAEPN